MRIPRLRARDLAQWELDAQQDPIVAETNLHRNRVATARRELEAFARLPGGGYCGVSWGKDSVCVAHMVCELASAGGPVVPLVWVVVQPIDNPYCPMVRDEFLRRYPGHPYEEIIAPRGRRRASEEGFAEAARRHGDRHVSGVRARESSARMKRCKRWGHSTERTCAPLSWWTGDDVFAYLYNHDLPVHPAYAMSLGGSIPRDRLRVSSLGGERGSGLGRTEWEETYYPDKMREIRLWRGRQ